MSCVVSTKVVMNTQTYEPEVLLYLKFPLEAIHDLIYVKITEKADFDPFKELGDILAQDILKEVQEGRIKI